MRDLGKFLIVTGLSLAGVGALLLLWPQLRFLGNLPGDIRIEKPNFRFYLPLTTCILLSLLISLLARLMRK